eukprot:g30092.t1
MGPLGACGWDEHVRLGCAAAECPCSWLERCMPRYELVRQHSSYELVNVGVCATSHLQPLFATVLLAVLLLLGTLLAKWSLRIWEPRTDERLGSGDQGARNRRGACWVGEKIQQGGFLHTN